MAADQMACSPLPHSRLTVYAGVDSATGSQGNTACVVCVRANLANTAHDDFGDVGRCNTGPFNSRPGSGGTEFVGGDIFERSALAADGRPGTIQNDDLVLVVHVLSYQFMGGGVSVMTLG